MLHVGLTGGLATGKSAVGRALSDLGCFLIKMDELGHEVMEPGGEAYDAVVALFGPQILNPDGTINRKVLGARVFSDAAELERLNNVIHPAVRARAKDLAAGFAREHPHGIAVTEAAILIETGSYKDFDRLIVAVCRPEQQMERAMARDGLSRQEVLDRLSRQMPLEDKLKYADFVIDTSGSKEETLQQVRTLYESLRSLHR
jgi:dephospho-CoA kinase